MRRFAKLPRSLFRLIRQPPRWIYALGLGPLIGRLILLLTTTGRKTGSPHTAPLQYEAREGVFYIGSARGEKADWYRNLLADPHVEVQIGRRRFKGIAHAITERSAMVDFLQLRLERRPRMMRAILRAQGAPPDLNRSWLEVYAAELTLVAVQPDVSEAAGYSGVGSNAAGRSMDVVGDQG
jgi:deazaflavin-dependent oxidoreductase (nitroreductase family)